MLDAVNTQLVQPHGVPRRTGARAAIGAALALAGVMSAPTPALAQSADRQRLIEQLARDAVDAGDRPLEPGVGPGEALGERLLLDVGLGYRQSFLTANDDDATSTQFWQSLLTVDATVSWAGAHTVSGRLALDYRDYADGDASSDNQPDAQLADPFVPTLWYGFDLARAAEASGADGPDGWNLRAHIGRRRQVIGSGLVLDLDVVGGGVEVEADRAFTARAFGGYTPPASTIDFDSSRPDYDEQTDRVMLGLEVELTADPAFRPYGFVLHQDDRNDTRRAVLPAGPVLVPTRFGYDSTYLGLGVRGRTGESWSWFAEGVYEWGRSVSSPVNLETGDIVEPTTEDIRAWALSAGATRLLLDDRDTRLEFGVIAASGDDDRLSSDQTLGGNARGTEDRAFNAFGLVDTGLALAPEPANLLIVKAGASSRLAGRAGGEGRGLRGSVTGFLYHKLDPDAGVSVRTDRGDGFVGLGLDLGARWDVASDVAVEARYGVFLPGGAIPDDNDNLRHLFYISVSYAF